MFSAEATSCIAGVLVENLINLPKQHISNRILGESKNANKKNNLSCDDWIAA